MLTKDFDNEFAALGAAEFTLCEQTFHSKEHVPYAIWRTLMRGDQRIKDDTPPEEVDRILFADLLDPGDLDRFMTLINSSNDASTNGASANGKPATGKSNGKPASTPSPTRAQVLAVYAWLMDVASGKAPKNEETSSAG
jgi:hypothetical protein